MATLQDNKKVIYGDNYTITKTENNSKKVDFWLLDAIDDFDKYKEVLKVFNELSENDKIVMHINCYGGYVDVAIQLKNAIAACGAEFEIIVEGVAMSAATFFFCDADSISVDKNTTIMVHCYGAGMYGKGCDIERRVDFFKKHFARLAKDCYGKFMSQEEIDRMLGGEDFWFSAEDWISRVQKHAKRVAEEAKPEIDKAKAKAAYMKKAEREFEKEYNKTK